VDDYFEARCLMGWESGYAVRRNGRMSVEIDARGLEFDIEPQAAIEPQDNFRGHFMLHFDGIARSGNIFEGKLAVQLACDRVWAVCN
tara:strand:- start:111 stop:371 length:261 start_codon:yes stop_codon:yes gene_type:complete